MVKDWKYLTNFELAKESQQEQLENLSSLSSCMMVEKWRYYLMYQIQKWKKEFFEWVS